MVSLEDIDKILDYTHSRDVCFDYSKYIENKKTIEVLYRGLPFPKRWLKEGNVIAEWYGCSHWSTDITVAKRFAKDYINDDFAENLSIYYNESYDNIEFVPVILKLNDATGYMPLCEILEKIGSEKALTFAVNEKEYSFFGYDFVIRNITEKNGCYICEVEKVKFRSIVNEVITDNDGFEITFI